MISVIYLQTPFQVNIFKRIVVLNEFYNSNWIVYYDTSISDQIINLKTFNIIFFYEVKGVFMKFYSSPLILLSDSWKVRKNIKKLRKNILKIVNSNQIKNFIFFSEKSIACQILIESLKPNTCIWAFDEGLGYYVKSKPIDNFLRFSYKVITPFLLSFNYQYFKVLGTHSSIDRLVLRNPNLRQVPFKGKIFSFSDLGIANFNKNTNLIYETNLKLILLLTTPSFEDNRTLESDDFHFIQDIVTICNHFGYYVVIKPHPREVFNKYSGLSGKFTVINSNIIFEEINVLDFSFIIQFFSSVILDLLALGFSSKKIISFYRFNHSRVIHLFKDTNIVFNLNELRNVLHD